MPTDRRDMAASGTADDVWTCDVENENVDLLTVKDEGQKDNWIGMGKQMGCTFGKAFGVSSMNVVSGGNWGVTDVSETLANKIADAIGGRAVHVDCKDVEIQAVEPHVYAAASCLFSDV